MNIHNHIQHNDVTYVDSVAWIIPQVILALPFILALILYILATTFSNRRYKSWPLHRTVFWVLGVYFAVFSIAGPLAARAHLDFSAHMLAHLLLGMLAPLFMVLAAPMTLILRTLSVPRARRLTKFLRSWPARMLTNPIIASFLNIGGLWLLYTTDLYSLMHESIVVHLIVHAHVFLAGYLFTVSIVYIDPIPHRRSFLYRAAVLILALAGHSILSKYIYAHPPYGVPLEQAELGGMLMYYGGDAIDIIIIFILCLQWFKATRPRIEASMDQQ
ncbi:cytochrome c oxidase assembly protein [Cytobacillus purgationiresistens]|uniref:Membrane protein n=1 Tax=Cytobacillus purgationiresistens TaxID=863449 RepID=A0ABU0AND3_9BACI|nr:cytochrome c oxidase assembly protein [Cytobacillus purgationiresistens]MDQ0272762.1 putative membrane protein [Cytobacillus purgationiresistens]